MPVFPMTQTLDSGLPSPSRFFLLVSVGGGEGVLAHDVDHLAIELLRPGAEDDVRAKIHLDMPHRDLQVESCECRDEACRGVAVEQENVALLVLEDGLELDQYSTSYVTSSSV